MRVSPNPNPNPDQAKYRLNRLHERSLPWLGAESAGRSASRSAFSAVASAFFAWGLG